MTARQQDKVAVLKQALPEFVAMRALAMRFRGALRRHSIASLDTWIRDANASDIYAIQRFATAP
jgi:hypothetical protein